MTHMTVKASPRPAKGTAQKQRRARRRLVETRERAAKDAAKRRDGYKCRVPDCPQLHALHSMHIKHAGIGGDPTGLRSWERSDYVTGCAFHHNQQHAGYLRFQVGPKGGDGRVWFDVRPSLTQDWVPVGWSEAF